MRKSSPSKPIVAVYDTRTIHALADQAESLARRFSTPFNVWMAIKNEQGPHRTSLFLDVLDELKRRTTTTR